MKTQKKARFEIRADGEEVARWKKAAARLGYADLSKLVRKMLDGIERGETKVKSPVAQGYSHAKIYHLARVGNNLNQIAYAANKAAKEGQLTYATAKEIASELMYMNIMLSKLLASDNN